MPFSYMSFRFQDTEDMHLQVGRVAVSEMAEWQPSLVCTRPACEHAVQVIICHKV
jgi:hypothetical protein